MINQRGCSFVCTKYNVKIFIDGTAISLRIYVEPETI